MESLRQEVLINAHLTTANILKGVRLGSYINDSFFKIVFCTPKDTPIHSLCVYFEVLNKLKAVEIDSVKDVGKTNYGYVRFSDDLQSSIRLNIE